MAKPLKEILNGVKASAVTPGSVGKDPHVDYMPKPPDEQNWVAIHPIEKHADRVGNQPELFNGSNIQYSMATPQMSRYGHPRGKDKEVYGKELEGTETPIKTPKMDSGTAGDQFPSMTADFGRIV